MLWAFLAIAAIRATVVRQENRDIPALVYRVILVSRATVVEVAIREFPAQVFLAIQALLAILVLMV